MGNAYQLAVVADQTKRRIALLEEGRLLEYYQEEVDGDGVVGTIYLGRVERVLPDVKAAFVKIGLKQNGFLPLKEAESFHAANPNAALLTGNDVIVQAKKAPKGGKGAFLTRDIALPGQYVLLMPRNCFVGLSKRIEDTSDRERAKKLGEWISQKQFGVIVRHAALFASEDDVLQEAQALWNLWNTLQQKAAFLKAPTVLHAEAGMQEILLRDYCARHELIHTTDLSTWNAFRIDEQLKNALQRRVKLENGGSLVIDEREALQTIDVNSGSLVKASQGMSLALQENLEAVSEIARQIRLRNLSGIILIDFIDMETDSERQQVANAVEKALSDDRVKTVVHGFTRLGLLEVTRKRTGDSLRDLLTVPCDKCGESGYLRKE